MVLWDALLIDHAPVRNPPPVHRYALIEAYVEASGSPRNIRGVACHRRSRQTRPARKARPTPCISWCSIGAFTHPTAVAQEDGLGRRNGRLPRGGIHGRHPLARTRDTGRTRTTRHLLPHLPSIRLPRAHRRRPRLLVRLQVSAHRRKLSKTRKSRHLDQPLPPPLTFYPFRRITMNRIAPLLTLAAALALAGCVPERVVWSPDGTQAAVLAG